ncbi:PEP-CTERM sorting domain-containing protein [Pontiellaceae bacterium B12219]|nr:PEP-CTERM sorting domain-containing protein [Pontiellaceae bacterium B12219]
MKRIRSHLMVLSLIGHSAFALYVPEGAVVDESGYLVISEKYNDNELLVKGKLNVGTGLVVGDSSDYTIGEVSDSGVVETPAVFVGSSSFGSEFCIKDGGVVSTSTFWIYGEKTYGIPYSFLRNSVTVSGTGAKLNISGQLDIWSPYAPGQPGDSFHIPREIPALLSVLNGGEVSVGSLSIINGNWLNIGSGGKLTIHSDYDASDGHVNLLADGTLAIDGELSGISMVEAGRRIEAASILGNINVDGVLNITDADGAGAIQGDLVISEEGTLELSTHSGITVSGQATLGGKLRVKVDEGEVLSVGDQIQLFNFEGGVSGNFESVAPLSGEGALAWDFSQLNSTGVLHVIPEPATLALVGMGGLMLAFHRRKSGQSAENDPITKIF